MQSEFNFEDKTGNFAEYEQTFLNVYQFCLAKLGRPIYYILSLIIVDREESLRINRVFRQKDYVADVITFAYLDDQHEKINDEFADLGEIMLCPEAIEARAAEVENDFRDEMIELFIHGLLHIFGFDHVDDDQKAEIMFSKQEELFQQFRKEDNHE